MRKYSKQLTFTVVISLLLFFALIISGFFFYVRTHGESINAYDKHVPSKRIIKDTLFQKSEPTAIHNTALNNQYINYPIPQFDSILKYYETSGAVDNSFYERYYSPSDSGIYVFYTLFNKVKMKKSNYSFDEINIGTLTTHTYNKPKYGWKASDKDQTFILLQVDDNLIQFGKSIQVGNTFKELTTELGEPIYQVDSSFVFLGKNKIIGKFKFKNSLIQSYTYGRFNLKDEIFEMDSIKRKEIIEEDILNGIN